MAYIDKGKQAEYLLASELLGLGMTPCWPSCESQPFDLICASDSKTCRIQVKGSVMKGKSIPVRLKLQDGGKIRRYTSKDVDYIAVYLYEYDEWYILPIEEIHKTSVSLRPGSEKCRWAAYRNAWHLLS